MTDRSAPKRQNCTKKRTIFTVFELHICCGRERFCCTANTKSGQMARRSSPPRNYEKPCRTAKRSHSVGAAMTERVPHNQNRRTRRCARGYGGLEEYALSDAEHSELRNALLCGSGAARRPAGRCQRQPVRRRPSRWCRSGAGWALPGQRAVRRRALPCGEPEPGRRMRRQLRCRWCRQSQPGLPGRRRLRRGPGPERSLTPAVPRPLPAPGHPPPRQTRSLPGWCS